MNNLYKNTKYTKVFVTGANGMLGTTLQSVVNTKNFLLTDKETSENIHWCDIRDLKYTTELVNKYQPDIILLSIFSSQSLDFTIPLSTWLREISPDAYIMIGGRGIDNIERQSKLNYAEFFLKYLSRNLTAIYAAIPAARAPTII